MWPINYINKFNYFIDYKAIVLFIIALFSPATLYAITPTKDFTDIGFGIAALAIFIIAYALVVTEEFLHSRKSKPAIAAEPIWIMVSISYMLRGDNYTVAEALRHNFLEYAKLMLFLLSARQTQPGLQ